MKNGHQKQRSIIYKKGVNKKSTQTKSAPKSAAIKVGTTPSTSGSSPSAILEKVDDPSEQSNHRRKYDTISDEDRLKLILLIKTFGMSCHKASKVLSIAYNNAKVIYRIYKNERRIRQTPKQEKRHAKTIRADKLGERASQRRARVEALLLDVRGH